MQEGKAKHFISHEGKKNSHQKNERRQVNYTIEKTEKTRKVGARSINLHSCLMYDKREIYMEQSTL